MTARAEALRQELRGVLLTPETTMGITVPARTQAAVLVPLYVEHSELQAVFTERRSDLRRHPGEISFPGGRHEPSDPDLLATALRETEEEIGLPAAGVEIVGALTPTATIASGYAIHPFVGVIEPGMRWRLAPREVQRVIELPLSKLRGGFGRRTVIRRGVPIRTDTYLVDELLIWGATARILSDLIGRVDSLSRRRA